MGWGHTTSYVRINDYAGAKRVYENTKPLRGTVNFRPIGGRSSRNPTQIICTDEGVYVIRLWSTDIIKYFPDGTVHLDNGGYVTNTTANAISYMSPVSCWNKTVNGHREMQIGTRIGMLREEFVLANTLTLRVDHNGCVPVDPPVAYIYKERVKKDKARKARALFKPVEAYIKLYLTAFPNTAIPQETMVESCEQRSRLHAMYDAGLAPTDEEASILAWAFSSNRGLHTLQNVHVGFTDSASDYVRYFWKYVYDRLALRETYKTALPYGTVAE